MKSYDASDIFPEGRMTYQGREHHQEPGLGPDSRTRVARVVAASPPTHHPTQAERAVMHPDCQDLEWSYYRCAWIG